MDIVYDLIIIGIGPAGITASIYAKRAGLNFLVFKNPYDIDSQILNTYEIDNYTGYFNITGQELYNNFIKHMDYLKINPIKEKVIDIQSDNGIIKKIYTKNKIYNTKTVIIATGTHPKKLGIDNEDKYEGIGLSYCATCDGAFFKNKNVAVVGSGNVACEDAIFLSNICNNVYLIIRKNYMKADKILQNKLLDIKNINILYNTTIININGKEKIDSLNLLNDSNNNFKIDVDGLFVAVGSVPNTNFAKNILNMNNNYIIASEDCKTNIDGIFACGDVRNKMLYQVITACSDGANAITSVIKYLSIN